MRVDTCVHRARACDHCRAARRARARRYGECSWDSRRADKLKYMLQASVTRRFPKGLKVHVQCGERSCLAHLFSALSLSGFWITRADVRTVNDRSAFEFTITDTQGGIPNQREVTRICESVGGIMYQQQDAKPGARGGGVCGGWGWWWRGLGKEG